MRSRWVLSLLSSTLIYSALQGCLWGATIWVAYLPLFLLLDQLNKPKEGFYWAFMTGFLLYLISAAWLYQVTVVGAILVCVFLSFYFAVFGWIYVKLSVGKKKWGILLIAALWTFLEYIRSLGPMGFPWFFVGYSQFMHLNMIQIVSIGGNFCLSFLIIWVNRSLYEILKHRMNPRTLTQMMISVVMILGTFVFGQWRLSNADSLSKNNPSLKIGIVQGNVSEEDKWNPVCAPAIMKKYKELSLEAARSKPDVIVWPETSIPGDYRREKPLQRLIRDIALETLAHFLIGANDDRNDHSRIITNAAYLIDPQGRLLDQYDKIHLVPYGEYVPLRMITPWVGHFTIGEIDFSPGSQHKVFQLNNRAFSSVICFEDIFPYLVRKFVNNGARLIINITNDAWFGNTQAPNEHFNLSRFSAIANGVGMVRATNTGLSGFISPLGEVLETVKDPHGESIEIEGFAVREMKLSVIRTFYQKYGDLFSWICGLIVLVFILNTLRKRKEKLC